MEAIFIFLGLIILASGLILTFIGLRLVYEILIKPNQNK